MSSSSVLTVELGSILHITLNRADKHNAFDPEMIELLTESFIEAKDNPHIRAIILRGEGPSFCSGADLNWMKSMKAYSLDDNIKDSEKLYDMFNSAIECPHPIVGAFHGNVMGGGLGLVAICDIGISHQETKFCFSETRLGLVPAVISPFVLRKMNFSAASEYIISAKLFGAEQALSSGLVQYNESQDNFETRIKKTVERLGQLGPEAVQETKRLLNLQRPIHKSVKENVIRSIAERRVSDEGQEGLKAFFEKSQASWKKELNYES